MTVFFEEKQFYSSKYPTAAGQIRELNENLNKAFYGDPNKIILYEEDILKNFSEDEDDEPEPMLMSPGKTKIRLSYNNKYTISDPLSEGASPKLNEYNRTPLETISSSSEETTYQSSKTNCGTNNNTSSNNNLDHQMNHEDSNKKKEKQKEEEKE